MSRETLAAEAATWVLDDPIQQAEKLRRERIRQYKLVRDLLLDKLDVSDMDVLEVGGGPLPVSDLLRFRSRIVVDPLSDQYKSIAPCPDHVAALAEDMDFASQFDLIISTNSLDHVDDPALVTQKMIAALRPGGYMAILCGENTAFVHPHPAHNHNLTEQAVLNWTRSSFETVWNLNYSEHGYRYGWLPYQGQCGHPAFALLLRKVTGFGKL